MLHASRPAFTFVTRVAAIDLQTNLYSRYIPLKNCLLGFFPFFIFLLLLIIIIIVVVVVVVIVVVVNN